MFHTEEELKSLIDLTIKYHESHYLFNQQKAEDGLKGLMDLLIDYQEVIQCLINSNKEQRIEKKVN